MGKSSIWLIFCSTMPMPAPRHISPTSINRRQATGLALALAGSLAAPSLWAAGGKGTAVLAIDADPPTLNLGTTSDFAAGDVSAKILEGLVWLDKDYNPQPALATAWTVSPDGKTYRFTLRRGVKWHDGREFSGADVRYSLMEIVGKLHPRAAPVFKSQGVEV